MQFRALEQSRVAMYAYGTIDPTELLVLLPAVTDPGGQEAFIRLSRQVQSLGPRVLKQRRSGAIGTVAWRGELAASWTAAFPEGRIAELARELFDQALISGIAACMAYKEETTNAVRLSRLGGFLYLLFPPNDISGIPWGLYQAWQSAGVRSWEWTVRIYNPEQRRIYEWKHLAAPFQIGITPTSVIENGPIPRYVILQENSDGQPLGEMLQMLPLFRRELAQQMRGDRMEEATAFPILSTSGTVQTAGEERSPTRVLHFIESAGHAQYLAPGDIQQAEQHHVRTIERIRDDMSLPGGFLPSGGNPPSGEALREANAKYVQACDYYANALTSVLNEGLTDFAALSGLGAPQLITVTPSRLTYALEQADRIINAYDKGMIPLTVAVRELDPILTATSSAELAVWAKQQEQKKPGGADLVRSILTGRAGQPGGGAQQGDAAAGAAGAAAAPKGGEAASSSGEGGGGEGGGAEAGGMRSGTRA